MRRRVSATRRAILFAVVPLALLGSGVLVWQASYSAFTATAPNNGNTWTTGTVVLNTDESGQVAFNLPADVRPDSSLTSLNPPASGPYTAPASSYSGGAACIKVSYSGSVNANVRLWATLGGDTSVLATWMLFGVDTAAGAGADPQDLGCASFPASANMYGGGYPNTTVKIATFPTDWASASGTEWSNVATGGVRWYRLSWLIPSTVTATASATRTLTATFTWEAHSV